MNKFFNAYTNVYRPYIHHINMILEPYDLYAAQYKILRDISEHQPTTLVQVSKRSFIEKPTARKMIKKLIDHDLVHAQNSDEDKREKFLTLTELGSKQYVETFEKIKQFQESCFKSMDIELHEMEVAERVLEKLRTHLIEEANHNGK
ncbi:MarR family winged helix-turn-helix transcriptional regulator [Mammaliicoccus stepanovicii]|uniref:MarR family regulatory protein n=1 Tax=Mammaliicoccus stepanovicii TaxID=643214 RepID=A0A239YHJ8_9STAP|nr:MarR family transcriptional regulator [Mammaliicoccus stepanovicii]PNZ74692.1 hypothetical protein CD111_08560 [Mammaliicoccus stepanovicii]GGI40841.1 MarR family transcriptional regulator [Mammaliicoccus stepanovicii]SNV58210.1 MarR family regulatory protein [Mammaliicoccus stepanovicii]